MSRSERTWKVLLAIIAGTLSLFAWASGEATGNSLVLAFFCGWFTCRAIA